MSGNTGFKFAYNLAGRTSGILRRFIIANSSTITIGDMVKLTSGYAALPGAGAPCMGVVVGLTDKNGIDLNNSKLTLAGSGAGWTKSTYTFVAGSDNVTTDAVKAVVDVDPMSVWSGVTDNASTDTQSVLQGCYVDLVAASDQADDDTAATTQATLFIWGVDPEDSGRVLYSIAEHQLWQAT
jgi:hypothetical protein